MENLLTKENLVANMLKKLQAFNNEKVVLAGTTVHGTVLGTESSALGRPAESTLYMWAVEWIIQTAGAVNVTWPENWLDLSVNDLADFIISKQTV